MRPTSPDTEADELDLPPLDGTLGGEGEAEEEGPSVADGDLDETLEHGDHGDAFDDATGEADALEEMAVDGAEGGWLTDSDDAKALDVGVFDISLSDEVKLLQDDEAEEGYAVDDELAMDESAVHADSGEEGPLAEDDELREEDLPALDADEDGDVDDAALFEGAAIGLGVEQELRWDDRAWERVGQTRLTAGQSAYALEDADDSGLLAVPGDDPKLAARDAAWRRLDESGHVTAAAVLPGDTVILALDGPERPTHARLVRIMKDGVARIIAEIESPAGDEEAVPCRVTSLRWDPARGCIVATGTFGAQAFRPA